MSPLEALRGDFVVLRQMLRGMPRDRPHPERLAAFYGPQGAHYDRFRERLLPGRADLIARLRLSADAHVVELGGGTGRNLDFLDTALGGRARIDLVDLCPALLERAKKRAEGRPGVRIVHADATHWRPAEPVDCVYFSYALSMIPDWRAAVDNALAMLKPGGVLGVVDFYVSAAEPAPGCARHSGLERRFWRAWFAHDGVHVDRGQAAHLRERLPEHEWHERRARLPYLPGLRAPYYLFIGRKT